MEIFLYDKGESYTYSRLFYDVANATSYTPVYKFSTLYEFFKNFISALIYNKEVTLIDSDINDEELTLDKSLINKDVKIEPDSSLSQVEIAKRVNDSESKISIFTSGTTGQPKKVVHNIHTLSRNVRRGQKYEGNVWGFCYNPTHMAGVQVLLQAFANQNTLVNLFNQSRDYIYESIESRGITHISATPTFYRMLLPFEKEFKDVVRITFGGEKSDMHLYESIKSIFPNAKINNIYASTEAGSLLTAKGEYFQIPLDLEYKFRIKDGELQIHKSLLGASESFTYDNDFYRTGDIVEWIDEAERTFRFISRKNSMINVGGYKVNPEEVEAVIEGIEGVQNALVYGKPNSVLGNILCADIKLQKDKCIDERNIRQILTGRLQDFKIPRRIKFVEEIATTRTGKIKRN